MIDVLRELPDETVNCVVTSPPYWGLRDYGTGAWEGGEPDCDHLQHVGGPQTDRETFKATAREERREKQFGATCGKCGAIRVDRQIGLEPTPDEYVGRLVDVFAETRRVLRADGTLWLNLGDSYAGGGGGNYWSGKSVTTHQTHLTNSERPNFRVEGMKPKDLVGIPWMVAFALRADGWFLRSDIVWSKPNPMPESVTDRPTKAHEYVFLLSKSGRRYFYDADAIAEPAEWARWGDQTIRKKMPGAGSWLREKTKDQLDAEHRPRHRKQEALGEIQNALKGGDTKSGFNDRWAEGDNPTQRNKRTVWTIATESYEDAHFATFPQALVEPCVKAGCPEGGVVLDPFMGSGTTALVARRLGRRSIGIELNPEYAQLAAKRLGQLSLCGEAV